MATSLTVDGVRNQIAMKQRVLKSKDHESQLVGKAGRRERHRLLEDGRGPIVVEDTPDETVSSDETRPPQNRVNASR
jgi:hypothetical protein